ncbi:MAG: M61 family metallopeptidase [Candidatus Kariarchaeaceae archaeon]
MAILYEIYVEKLNEHLVDVKLIFDVEWDSPILEMPSWTPGSYLIRDYARHLQEFSIRDEQNNSIGSVKTRKNAWKVHAKSGQKIFVHYRIYAFELTVRTSYLDNRKALLTPSSLFMYMKSKDNLKHTKNYEINLSIHAPEDWLVFTSLRKVNGDYKCTNYDELVDSPICMGIPEIVDHYSYVVEEKDNKKIPCEVVIIGDKGNHNIEDFASDLQKIQNDAIDMFGELPYDRYYWLLYIVGQGGGGLEHKYSNCSIIPRWYFQKGKNYTRLLSLEAHEHFHVYNIKRIRPAQLGPFDYSNEVYTRTLWVAEGLTSFYDKLVLARTGLISQEEYWELIAKNIQDLYGTPGRFKTSLSDASFNAWIKLYKPDENTFNSYVSYYLKGGIVGLMLDLEIREQTKWVNSLDSFFKHMYQNYKEKPHKGFNEHLFKDLVQDYTRTNLDQFWEKYIDGTDKIDINYYLRLIGMNLVFDTKSTDKWIGLRFKEKSMIVEKVIAESPAMIGGIYPRDEIIGINGFRASNGGLNKVLANIEPKETVQILLIRDDKILSVDIQPSEPIPDKYEIIQLEDCGDLEKSRQELFFKS